MKNGKEQIKDQKENSGFDYSKTWYIIPYYSMTEYNPDKDFLGPMYEGKIISNERFFSDEENEDFQAWFCLTDFITMFDNLSEPFVYPVKVEQGTRTEQGANNSWAAERMVLLKPLNIWEFFSMAEDIFQGSINFDGQPYLPNGLRFPLTMKGNIKFDYNFLPSIISLPDSVEGTIFVRFCQIPPTWQFPKNINCLKIDSCTFYDNLDFRKIEVADLQFRNCIHPPFIPFPEIFTGKLSMEGVKMSSSFIFPRQVGSLYLSEVHLNAGKLPDKVDGDLTLYKVHFSEGISLPGSCKTFTAVESIFQEGFIMPKEGLEEIHMVLCTLPKIIIIPDITFKKLTFSEMKIPAGLKIPKEFNGSLEFDNCEFSKGFRLPDKITGRLKITCPKLKTQLKLPKRGEYDFEIGEDDDLSSFDIPISRKQRLKQPLSGPEKGNSKVNHRLAKNSITLTNPNSLDLMYMEIKEFDNQMNLPQAKNACIKLGDDWRLPTRKELEIIYDDLHKKGKRRFSMKNYYWSSTKSPDGWNLAFSFADGRSYINVESGLNGVIAVQVQATQWFIER